VGLEHFIVGATLEELAEQDFARRGGWEGTVALSGYVIMAP
jgi:hypothetical protein